MTRETGPGALIGSGRAADVFDLGDGRVLRRYKTEHRCEAEAEIMALAHAAGFPVPWVYRVDGRDLVMDRITGPTMLQQLERAPWLLFRAADQLARLHQRLHAIPFGDGCLVHMDLHPGNVILSPAGPVVIDWSNAASGAAAADVAQTWVIIGASAPDGRPGPARSFLLLLRGLYLRRFLGHFDRAAVLACLSTVADERMRDRNVTPAERGEIVRLLARHRLRAP